MWAKRLNAGLSLGVMAVLLLVSGSAAAQSPRAPVRAEAAASPAAPSALLYEQFDSGTVSSIGSYDVDGSVINDNQAADDFVLGTAGGGTTDCAGSCRITKITVFGNYQSPSGNNATSVRLQIYNELDLGRPEELIYDEIFGASSPQLSGLSTGDFVMTPTVPITLTNGHYWLSVQATSGVSAPPRYWLWREYPTQKFFQSVWQNPGNGHFTGCTTWTARTTCGVGSFPDLAFRLEGETTGPNPVPVISYLSPGSTLPGSPDFSLTIRGYNFVSTSQIKWNDEDRTADFTFHNSTRLSVTIPPDDVLLPSIFGIPVRVNNPPDPTFGGGGLSEPEHFIIAHLIQMPYLRR